MSHAVARLRRLLAAAGFGMVVEGGSLLIRRLPLYTEPPADFTILSLLKEVEARVGNRKIGKRKEARSLRPLTELYDALDAVTPDTPTVLVFDPPLLRPSKGNEGDGQAKESLRWLPVLPACDRPPRRLFDGSEEPHELTADLRRVVRLLRKREQGPTAEEGAELFYAARRLLSDASADLERQLRRLLKRQGLNEAQREELQTLLARLGKKLDPIWEALGLLMPSGAKAWLEWLRQTHELERLIDMGSEVRLPLDDLRLRLWAEEPRP